MTAKIPKAVLNEGKILIYNCILDKRIAADYEKGMKKKIITGKEIVFASPGEAEAILEKHPFSHLIISGSSLSSLDSAPWDDELSMVISHFIEQNGAILGICYGHQILAAYFLGKSCLKRMDQPEFGWNPVKLQKNLLFKGVDSEIFCHIHYDSVAFLSSDFSVIAENEFGIQGFQYKSCRVFGLQFHPDFDFQQTITIFKELRKTEPEFDKYLINREPDSNTDTDGAGILTNFVTN